MGLMPQSYRKAKDTLRCEGQEANSSTMMICTNIRLPAEMFYDIRDTAASKGVSIAQEVRTRLEKAKL